MKVEFGFQANCSETTLNLGFVEREEIVAAMKKIQEITGWTWRIESYPESEEENSPCKSCYVHVPVDVLDDVFVIDDLSKVLPFGIDRGKLVSHIGSELPEKIKKSMLQYTSITNAKPKLVDIPPDTLFVDCDHVDETLSVSYGFEEEDGFVLWYSEYGTPILPPFHKIRLEFKKGIPYGRQVSWYWEWMLYHFIDKREYVEYLKTEYESKKEFGSSEIEGCDNGKEWIENRTGYFEKYPPLPGTGKLPETEIEVLKNKVYPRWFRQQCESKELYNEN